MGALSGKQETDWNLRHEPRSQGPRNLDNEAMSSSVRIYPLDNYSFGVQEYVGIDKNFHRKRLEGLKESFAVRGMGKAVEAVTIVHLHNHPHVLLLQHQTTFFLYATDQTD